MLHIVHNVLSV